MKADTFYFMRKERVDLLRYLPKFLEKSPALKDVYDTLSAEHENYRLKIVDTARQFFLETSTWGLEDWERFLKITPREGQGFELRKTVCRVKLRGLSTMTPENTVRLMEEFMTSGHAGVEELGDDEIRLILDNGVFYWQELFKALWEYLPAHLEFSLKFHNHYEMALYPAQIIDNVTEDEIDYASIARNKLAVNVAGVIVNASTAKIDYDFSLKTQTQDISVGNYFGIGGYELIAADIAQNKFDGEYEKILYEKWRRWNKNPLVKIYSHHFPVKDGNEPEEDDPEDFFGGDIIKLYFKHADNRVRIVSLPHPKENITGAELNEIALWVIENCVMLNSAKSPAKELLRASYITKTVDRIL